MGDEEPRVLVTLHYPLLMHAVADILSAVAKSYPTATVGSNGKVWSKPTDEEDAQA